MSPDIIIAPASFAMVGYITGIVVQAWTRRHRLKVMTDFQNKLLDKLGSVKDFGDFLQTDVAHCLMADFGAEPVGISSPKNESFVRHSSARCSDASALVFPDLLADIERHVWRRTSGGECVLAPSRCRWVIGFVVSTVASFRLAARMGLPRITEVFAHRNRRGTSLMNSIESWQVDQMRSTLRHRPSLSLRRCC